MPEVAEWDNGQCVSGEVRYVTDRRGFPMRFPTILPLDHHDSTSIQLLVTSSFIPYPNQPLKVSKKFLSFHAI